MKKSFLIVGVLGAIIATNGYAVQSQSGVVTRCTPPCVPKTETSGQISVTYCVNEKEGTRCPEESFGKISQASNVTIQYDMGSFEKVKKIEAKKKSEIARVAKNKQRVAPKQTSANEPITVKSESNMKVGSGWGIIECPSGCHAVIREHDGKTIYICYDENGKACDQENVEIQTSGSITIK